MGRRTGWAAIAGGFALVLLLVSFAGTSSAAMPLHVQDFAGYQTYKTGATTASTTFTVPTVTCGAGSTGIEPGLEAMVAATPSSTAYLYGATLKMTCVNGALSVVEAMFASGIETDYSRPVAPRDSLTASFLSSANGSVVSLQDKTLGHAFTLTDSGTEAYALGEYLGVQADSVNGQFVPAPAFTPAQFSATTVGGKHLGQITPLSALEYGAPSQCLVYTIPTPIVNNGQNFMVEIPPVNVTQFSPTIAPVGNVVTINGWGFASGTTVTFMGTTATGVKSPVVKVVSPNELQAVIPNAGVPGPFTVTNTKGTMTDLCSFDPQPVIAKLSVTKGRTGTAIKITGGGFSNITSLLIGSYPFTTYTEVNPTVINATIPNGSLSGYITLNTLWGSWTTTSPFIVTLSITGFSPTSGSAGTVVDIRGVGFNSSSAVKFGGVAASKPTLVSSTELKAIVPAKFMPGPITVTNSSAPSGTVASAGSFS